MYVLNEETQALLQATLVYGTIGAFGGTAHYVYQAARKGRSFNGWGFIANVFLAFSVSTALVLWVGVDSDKREFYALVTGFFAYPILDLADEHKAFILRKIRNLK